MKKKTQNAKILSHLKRGWKITQDDAYDRYRVYRLASRIHDLRNEGWDIRTKLIDRNGNTYAQYQLAR